VALQTIRIRNRGVWGRKLGTASHSRQQQCAREPQRRGPDWNESDHGAECVRREVMA
jgi:hypothetical protein